MRVALAQINTTVGDIWGNVEKMADTLERATDSGAELVAYPELTIPGYPPEDLLMRQSFIEENIKALHEFAGRVYTKQFRRRPVSSALDAQVRDQVRALWQTLWYQSLSRRARLDHNCSKD